MYYIIIYIIHYMYIIYIYIVFASNTISKLRDGELHACVERSLNHL